MGRSGISSRRRGPLSSTEAAEALGVCERTLRRYIASDHIRYHRLPGGHYRIPEEAIAEFWVEQDRRRRARKRARSTAHPAARAPDRSTNGARRPALGHEQGADYDLSLEHLAELRARFATRTP